MYSDKKSAGDPAKGEAGYGGANPWALAQLLFDRRPERPGLPLETAQQSVARLARALQSERRRGKAGHWTYDLNRHIALAQALKTELSRLKQLKRMSALRSERAQNKIISRG